MSQENKNQTTQSVDTTESPTNVIVSIVVKGLLTVGLTAGIFFLIK